MLKEKTFQRENVTQIITFSDTDFDEDSDFRENSLNTPPPGPSAIKMTRSLLFPVITT